MRVASLGSGSKGNATVVQAGDTRILIDCGFGLKDIESRLHNRGILPESLTAILVTHEHSDHIKGAPLLANKYGIPLHATHGTARHFKRHVATASRFTTKRRFKVGQIDIEPITVPHDSAEPSQFIFHHSGHTFGLLTDLGSITNHVVQAYKDCQVLMLECNHDPEMLQTGPYPPSLKRRVGGRFGHLSNEQAYELLQQINRHNLQQVLVSHVSEQNNDPKLALDTIQPALDEYETAISFLTQADGCDWVALQKR